MELLYKPDWEETKERYKAWWAHEVIDRCAISVTAPRADLPPDEPPPLPEKVEDRWLDIEYIRASNEYRLPRTFFGGEAIPIWGPGYPGCKTIPTFLGAPIELKEDTGWVSPIIDEGDLTDHDYRELVIDPDNRWWVFTRELLGSIVKDCKGKALAPVGAFGGCGDTLAWLRGSNELLFDLVDCPDYVREFETYLMRQWMEVYDVFYEIAREADEGSTGWFNLWSPGKFYAAQNDFSYMISPQMYREIFLPVVDLQTNFLDHSIYHVDGIGAFAHVDALCELPHLQALQILPGEGKPSPLQYMDVLKKVQAAGKNVHIGIPPEEVETAITELSIKRLFIETHCDTEDEARALLKNVVKWSARSGT